MEKLTQRTPILTWEQVENPTFIKSPNFHKGRRKNEELVVIHTMESPEKGTIAESIAKNWFGDSGSGVSAHYTVDNNSFVQCVWDSNTAFHCKNANANGLGIELAGEAKQKIEDWNDQFSQDLLVIAAQIGAYLSVKFEIPVQKAQWIPGTADVKIKGFCGHVEVPGHGSHSDPGTSFPWSDFLALTQKFRELYEEYLKQKGY